MIPLKTHLRKLGQIAATLALLWCAWAQPVSAANDDFIILLDQSGSMREKRPGDEDGGYFRDPREAKKSREALEALDKVIADPKLIKLGDYVSIVPFGSRTRVIVSQKLLYEHERDTIKSIVSDHLKFRDKKTDIVAGVKEAGDLIKELGSNALSKERRKILVMITDGKNDPPKESAFFSPKAQSRTYKELSEKIKTQNWKVTLVGLGDHTDITEVGKHLDLDKDDVLTIKSNADIKKSLFEKIKDTHDAKVAAEVDPDHPAQFKIRIKPGWFGTYVAVTEELSLNSTFPKLVKVEVKPSLELTGLPGLAADVTPSQLELKRKEPRTLTIQWRFTGDRPEDGVLRGRYKFDFPSPHTTRFYPYAGEVELVVVGWWDTYGLWVLFALAVLAVILWLIRREIRRRQVPEIKVMLVAGTKELSEKQTMRKHQKIAIANDGLAGGAVPVKELEVKQAATVTYLGRKRFRVSADEATLLYEGAEKQNIEIGLDGPFDLRDGKGHKLSGIMISTSGQDGPFGAGDDDAAF